MEPKFQTSFIPKKPLSSSASSGGARHSVSIFMTIGLILFILSLGAAGFVLVFQKYLLNQQDQYKSELAKDQDQFNTSLISTLATANTKINIAETLLANHLAVSQIFSIISQLTIQSVQWKSFDFSAPADDNGKISAVTITMQGEADSFYSIAYQSDVFGQSSEFGTNKVIKDPVLSNLEVDPDGHVDFTFTAMVDPSELSYASEIEGQASSTASDGSAPAQ